MGSVSILDFEEKTYITKSSLKLFTNGKVNLPNDSEEGEVVWSDRNFYIKFEAKNGKRNIKVKIKNYENGDEIGFNLGYGFGDTTKASENMLFYKGKVYKLEDVKFIIPMDSNKKYKYLEAFVIRSKDKAIDLTFTPILDRYDNINFGVIKSVQHQVFVRFNGTIKVEDKEVEFKDSISFVERGKVVLYLVVL